VWQQIRSGGWLTRERLHGYARIQLTVSLAVGMIWIALADGLIDRNDKRIGIDFSNGLDGRQTRRKKSLRRP
jgi:alpha-1,2-mannosyltransferase